MAFIENAFSPSLDHAKAFSAKWGGKIVKAWHKADIEEVERGYTALGQISGWMYYIAGPSTVYRGAQISNITQLKGIGLDGIKFDGIKYMFEHVPQADAEDKLSEQYNGWWKLVPDADEQERCITIKSTIRMPDGPFRPLRM
jgi:hypothetical protein